MRSKNHKAKTQAEADHIARVKEMDCAVCGHVGPSDAHHIEQEKHFTVIHCARTATKARSSESTARPACGRCSRRPNFRA